MILTKVEQCIGFQVGRTGRREKGIKEGCTEKDEGKEEDDADDEEEDAFGERHVAVVAEGVVRRETLQER